MSHEATTRAWAWDPPKGRAQAKLVLLCLADHHNGETDDCYPSIERISQMTGLSRPTVERSLHLLDISGAIRKSKRFRKDQGQTSSQYTFPGSQKNK